MQSLWFFAIHLVAFFAAHSLLAAHRLKEWAAHWAPRWAPWYRIAYNTLFLLWSIWLVWYYFNLPKQQIWQLPLWARIPGLGVAWAGWYIMRHAFRQYDWGEFVGTRYLEAGRTAIHTQLQLSGFNRCVRHPLYLGTLLLIWGLWWLLPSDALLVFSLLTTCYLPIGIWSEERKLVAIFGDEYRTYKARTPMLFPRIGCLRQHLGYHKERVQNAL